MKKKEDQFGYLPGALGSWCTCIASVQRSVVVALAACCLFVGMQLLAQQPSVAAQAPAEQLQELETVVVYGGYATPQMWKISKGGHVLWLLVTGNAPVGAPWRSEQLQARVAESQLVLYPATLMAVTYKDRSLDEGQYMHLPGKSTLKDVLPPETYARWRMLKAEYIGVDDRSEHLRPRAALRVLERLVEKTMPPPPPTGYWWSELGQLIDKAAKSSKVKVRRMPIVVPVVELTKAEAEMARLIIRLDVDDVKCFAQGLDDLERMIKDRDQQANAAAWARATSPSHACYTDWFASGKLPDLAAAQSMREKGSLRFKQALQQGDAEWMAAAQAALEKNKSTFAVHATGWGRPGNYIAKFRELGYEVEEPAKDIE